ncbi:hypothetical protein MTO96_026923 [Rhipicephalus appendiculatus]
MSKLSRLSILIFLTSFFFIFYITQKFVQEVRNLKCFRVICDNITIGRTLVLNVIIDHIHTKELNRIITMKHYVERVRQKEVSGDLGCLVLLKMLENCTEGTTKYCDKLLFAKVHLEKGE